MLEFLIENYKGPLTINGVRYENVAEVKNAFAGQNIEMTIVIGPRKTTTSAETSVTTRANNIERSLTLSTKIFRIKVRQYMTKPSSPGFDFQDRWNNGIPMPMRIMVGKILQETPKMVKMELWGEITKELETTCMKCGRTLTNPVSKYFGIGPECGSHNYVNPFGSKEELAAAVSSFKTQLGQVKWTGWMPKSAIEESELIREE